MKSITGLSPHSHPQGKHTPGLFKVEFKGNKMIGLCSKSYCTELVATENSPGQVKFSIKSVNKGQFKNPMPHYEHVLTTKQNFRACNQGIRAKNENALIYFYYLMDEPLYLWTSENFVYSENINSLHESSICHRHGLCI